MPNQQPSDFDVLPMAGCEQRSPSAAVLVVDIRSLLDQEVYSNDALRQGILLSKLLLLAGHVSHLLVGLVSHFNCFGEE